MLPLVFLSGHGDIPTTVQSDAWGAEDFLTKMAPKEELIDAVKRALARDANGEPSVQSWLRWCAFRQSHATRARGSEARREGKAEQTNSL